MAHDTELTGSMLSLPHCNVFCTPMYKGTQLSVAFFATCAGYLGLLVLQKETLSFSCYETSQSFFTVLQFKQHLKMQHNILQCVQ